MRSIVIHRWIFGLALLVASWQTWFVIGSDEGFLEKLLIFVILYIPVLAFSYLVFGIAWFAWQIALSAWDFLLRLLGLRG